MKENCEVNCRTMLTGSAASWEMTLMAGAGDRSGLGRVGENGWKWTRGKSWCLRAEEALEKRLTNARSQSAIYSRI